MHRIKDGKRFVKHWRKRTKIKLVEAFGNICCVCGQSFEPELYDFHHINPENKKFNISNSYSTCASWSLIVEEAKKCVMLCSNCHRLVEYGYTNLPINTLKFDETKITTTVERELLPKYARAPCPICGNKVLYCNTYCCHECAQKAHRKVKDRPSHEDLILLVSEQGFEAVGRLFGVTGNAVKKWLKQKT